MKGKSGLVLGVSLLFAGAATTLFAAGDWQIGVGLNAGVSRLEGDLNKPRLGPLVAGHVRFLPVPFLALEGMAGYSAMGADSHPDFSDFKTTIIPFELGAVFNFLPFRSVNPYVVVGGGGVIWSTEGTPLSPAAVQAKDGLDSFLKAGAGLEFRISRQIGLSLGATFRMSLTDNFDQLNQGDEYDQVLAGHAGFTYYFGGGGHDRDGCTTTVRLVARIEIGTLHSMPS